MSSETIIPMCPAVIRCAIMLVGAVCITFFSGELVQVAVAAGTF